MHEFIEEKVQHHMTRAARTIAPEMTAGDLLRMFATDNVDAYPVEATAGWSGLSQRPMR